MSAVARIYGKISSILSVAFTVGGNPALGAAFAVNAALMNFIGGSGTTGPPAQGSATKITIGANQPMPYAMGRTYIGGAQVHDVGYGGTVDGVPNPYSSTVFVWSLGPVQSIEAFQADFSTIAFSGGNAVGYYHNFMYLSTQLGACPESAALAGPFGAIPNWGSSYKLSGLCAGLWSAKFDKKGKVYASGFPQPGVILNLANAVYDARQDSTYPGGSGACRALNESTYVWGAAGENPSCHGVTYAMARFQNSQKVFGPAFTPDTIDWPAWVAFANVCDANGWKIGGIIYEGPGISRWDNLKRICAAGAAEPCFVGGLLSVRYSAPKTSLDTITAADLADGECQIQGMKTWRQRLNGIVPKYRSEAHQWEYVQSDQVTASTYVTEDGEEKSEERQYDLVQIANQAAQLAAYDLVNGRELSPIVLPLKPRLLPYLIGEALTVNIPELGLTNQLCTIIGRKFDPGKAIVTLTFETETSAKHAFALGQTGTAPPTPSPVTGEDMDNIISATNTAASLTVDSPRTVSFSADSSGTISSSQLPKVVTPTIFRGDLEIRTEDDVVYALQNVSSNLTTIAVNNTTGSADKGRVTISALGGGGSYELVVTIGDTVFPAIKVTVAVDRASASTGGGTGGGGGGTGGGTFDATGLTVSGSSFVELGRVSNLAVASGHTATTTFSCDYQYSGTSSGSESLGVKVQISVTGAGSWSDVGTLQNGTPSTFDSSTFDSTSGAVAISRTSTPSAGSYDYRVVGEISAPTGFINLIDGPGSVTVS